MGAFFLLRMNDHLQYLNRLKATLDGKGDFRGSDHHSCKFGKWLDTDGPKEVGEISADAKALFDSIIAPHQRFHEVSHEALAAHDAGNKDVEVQKLTEMHQLSGKLVDSLLTLDRMAAKK